ncbi:MAG TPA: DUF58 domain-containing protein [Acidobacteriaceae bacterium]|nr:DUF58 domain-containing protein [Acidobacteriaceae bacterium]
MLSTLIPPPVNAPAQGSRFGFGLTTRALLLLVAGCLLALPGFLSPHWAWFWTMAAWDALVLSLIIVDASLLPSPSRSQVERRFVNSPVLGETTEIEIEICQDSNQILDVKISDALHPALAAMPLGGRVQVFPRDPVRISLICIPNTRGDVHLGNVYLRYRAALGLVERWAAACLEQEVRVFPPMERSPEDTQLYLLRIRQIALQKRRLRLRGTGREFESLREYQRGDEVRNIAWPATARRGKLITREFTTERSQQVWIVLDAGRLSRTAFTIRRKIEARFQQSIGNAFSDDLALNLTQLDQSTGAAVALAQAVMQAGDKAGLLVYGQQIQQQLLPAEGTGHLRQFVDALSQVRAEWSEANHLSAAARLKHLQRRRGLILWITELADTARRPEVVDAAIDLARRHLVLLVVLRNPELDAMAAKQPATTHQMYVATASEEILERRRALLAQMRAQGVLVVETSADSVKADAINQYLDVKARGLL